MIALQYGGTDDEQNLQALCCECHAKKSIIENKKRESIKKAIDFIINQEISESPDPRIQNSM
jgi:5-methylcytosine-specific restriction endonuclease McrA